MDRRISGGVCLRLLTSFGGKGQSLLSEYRSRERREETSWAMTRMAPAFGSQEASLNLLNPGTGQGLVFCSNGLGSGVRHATHLQEGTDV